MQVVNYGACVCTLYGGCDYYFLLFFITMYVKFLYDEISTNFACKRSFIICTSMQLALIQLPTFYKFT